MKCTTGELEVTVKKLHVCWDAPPESPDDDSPLEGATVILTLVEAAHPGDPAPAASRPPEPKVTPASGQVKFDRLQPGDWAVTATKYAVLDADGNVVDREYNTKSTQVYVGATQVKFEDLKLKKQGLECSRKHLPRPGGGPDPNWLGPIFWSGEPAILVLREVLWLVCAVLIAIGLLIPPSGEGMNFTPGGLALTGIAAAFFGYLANVIFGMPLGIPLIIVAFIMFIGLIVSAIVSAVAAALGFPPPDPYGFAVLCGVWAGFAWCFVGGRREVFSNKELLHVIISAVLGAVAALIIYIVLVLLVSASGDVPYGAVGVWIVGVLAVITGALLGGVAGLLGLCFVNDGRTEMTWGATDFVLPYSGERYCVQGVRGFISHIADQEGSYDWSMPEGTPILCAKEGHIIVVEEGYVGNVRSDPPNSNGNRVKVRHKDGSIATYLHLMTNGVTGSAGGRSWNAELIPELPNIGTYPYPVHVYDGQILGACGDTGISMFPHLHFTVKRNPEPPAPAGTPAPTDTRDHLPVKFKDGDVGSHSGQCWSMRKYRSDNKDLGLIKLGEMVPD